MGNEILIKKTSDNIQILVSKGSKAESPFDFKVHYREPGKRIRTPKHVHIIIDLYMKLSRNEALTLKFVDYLVEMMHKLSPETKFPPATQISNHPYSEFNELNQYGEYAVEFICAITELIMIQEKTNYPNGNLNVKVFKMFRDNHKDIFAVVSAATFS